MRKDLEDKARMLNMYENNMADLSSKMHNLKKTLEEKDAEIRQLTDERQRWDISLEARSLASRAASDAGGLSDGCLSDGGEGEEGDKEVKKKKKPWKVQSGGTLMSPFPALFETVKNCVYCALVWVVVGVYTREVQFGQL